MKVIKTVNYSKFAQIEPWGEDTRAENPYRRTDYPKEKEHIPEIIDSKEEKAGINLPGYVRDLLMSELQIDITTAQSVAEKIDQFMVQQDWVTTFNGTSFKKSFDAGQWDQEQQNKI